MCMYMRERIKTDRNREKREIRIRGVEVACFSVFHSVVKMGYSMLAHGWYLLSTEEAIATSCAWCLSSTNFEFKLGRSTIQKKAND